VETPAKVSRYEAMPERAEATESGFSVLGLYYLNLEYIMPAKFKVQIDDKYRIVTIPANFVLEKHITVQTGKSKGETKWIPDGFYPKLEQALSGYTRRQMLEATPTCIDELKSLLGRLTDAIQAISKEVTV
jgi:hypothetical protein